MQIRADVALAPRTTLGVGGAARRFVEASTEDEVREALAWARDHGMETLVLGGGSNLLVADRGFDGLVIRARVRGITTEDLGSTIEVDAGAGVPWDDLVEHAVAHGWAGIECLSGIPGDVGATPIQNVGAYGQEVADTIVRVRAVDRATGEIVTLDSARCGFGYRDSVFKREDQGRFVVVRVCFSLRPGGAPSLRYAELQRSLAAHENPSLVDVRDAVIALRRSKSMVLDPHDENGKSAGSFFTNPTIPEAQAAVVADRAASIAPGETMPQWPAAGGVVKLSAAWLIERAGFRKGTHEGAVGLSTRHTLAIVNRGGATAAEVIAFARRVRAGVLDRFGVTLVAEPVLVGFRDDERL